MEQFHALKTIWFAGPAVGNDRFLRPSTASSSHGRLLPPTTFSVEVLMSGRVTGGRPANGRNTLNNGPCLAQAEGLGGARFGHGGGAAGLDKLAAPICGDMSLFLTRRPFEFRLIFSQSDVGLELSATPSCFGRSATKRWSPCFVLARSGSGDTLFDLRERAQPQPRIHVCLEARHVLFANVDPCCVRALCDFAPTSSSARSQMSNPTIRS
jgi:hypothetical protein